jgi:hypothetical protein
MLLRKQSLFTVKTTRNTNNIKDSVPASQETHYISDIKPNRLMLFGETAYVNYFFNPLYLQAVQIHSANY